MTPRPPSPLQVAYRQRLDNVRAEERFDQAKREIETTPAAFCQRDDLSTFDPSRKLQLAQILLKAHSASFCEALSKFQFQDEVRLDLLHRLAQRDPSMFLYRLHQLDLPGPPANVELAETLAKREPGLLCTQFSHFRIKDEDDRFKIARVIAMEIGDDSSMWGNFDLGERCFDIADDGKRLALAKAMVESNPGLLGDCLDTFQFQNKQVVVDIARQLAFRAPESLAARIHTYDIEDRNVRMELVQRIAERKPSALLGNISNFELGDSHLEAHLISSSAHACAKNSPFSFVRHLEWEGGVNGIDPTVLQDLVITAYVKMIQVASVDEARTQFARLPDYLQLGDLKEAAAQHGNKHPVFQTLIEAAAQESDQHVRETLSQWAHWTSLCMRNVPAAKCDQLTDILTTIRNWRAPRDRYGLTAQVTDRCMAANASGSKDFNEFVASITASATLKPHAKLLPELLFPLFSETAHEAIDFVKLLNRNAYKDSRVMRSVVNGILSLMDATITNDLRRSFLHIVTESSAGKKPLAVGQSLQLAGSLATLASNDSRLGREIHSLLEQGAGGSGLRSISDLETVLGNVFALLFNIEASRGATVADQFNAYLERSRRPNGLLNYTMKIHGDSSLPTSDKTAVVSALSEFVEAAILGSEDAFQDLRYDTTRSKHLQLIATAAPEKWRAWKQACTFVPSDDFLSSQTSSEINVGRYLRERVLHDRHIDPDRYPNLKRVLEDETTAAQALVMPDGGSATEAALLTLLQKNLSPVERLRKLDEAIALVSGQFQSDLKDLRTMLSSATHVADDYSKWQVVDTDNSENLLWSGTEVLGSCQHIDDATFLNKALMGYVLDGKYRMLAVTAPGGQIKARCMLRLMCEEGGTPVLHLERLYSNPGVPAALESALGQLARQKAAQMGCALVTHEDFPGAVDLYPKTIHSYGSEWPFEYVDAVEDNGVHEGNVPYSFSQAKIVAPAPQQ